MNEKAARYVIKDTTTRDTILGVLGGVLILGFIIYGVLQMSAEASGNWRTGKIVSKAFTPKAETEITIGKAGVQSQAIDGDYTMEVYVDTENRTFHVSVGKPDYTSHNVGDSFRFLLPPSEWKK